MRAGHDVGGAERPRIWLAWLGKEADGLPEQLLWKRVVIFAGILCAAIFALGSNITNIKRDARRGRSERGIYKSPA